MKVWMTTLLMFLALPLQQTAFQNMIEHDHSHPVTSFQEGEKGFVDPYYVQAGYLTVRPMQVKGFDAESTVKLEKAFEVLEKVVNSEEFKERVINFKNTSGDRAYKSNKGLTNEQIYQVFMEGRETLQQNTPGEMNFFLSLYYKRWSRVVGYTTGSTNVININWKFFKNYQANEVAGNLAHEWTHKIGFDHKSASEHDSAPYAIGYIVEDMAAKYLKNQELY